MSCSVGRRGLCAGRYRVRRQTLSPAPDARAVAGEPAGRSAHGRDALMPGRGAEPSAIRGTWSDPRRSPSSRAGLPPGPEPQQPGRPILLLRSRRTRMLIVAGGISHRVDSLCAHSGALVGGGRFARALAAAILVPQTCFARRDYAWCAGRRARCLKRGRERAARAALHRTAELPAAAGVAAVVGHIYPIWLGFRGGKGVATAAGAFFAPRADAALWAFGVFLAVQSLTRIVSLGSVARLFALPPIALPRGSPAPVVVAACGVAVLIACAAIEQPTRLLDGVERRFGR